MDIEVLAPKLRVDANVRLRLQVMAMVIYELGDVCGVDLDDTLEKGLVERDVIKCIRIWFETENENGETWPCACVKITIDWEKFKLVVDAEGDDSVPFEGLDFSNGNCEALDHKMLYIMKKHVSEIRKKYNITNVCCSFIYRDKYTKDKEIHSAARKYMNHVAAENKKIINNREFSKSLKITMNGLCDVLNVAIEFD